MREETDDAGSLGWAGGGLIRCLFIGPQPQRSVCLSACMMGGDKKLMHRHCGASNWTGHCCPLQGTPFLHVCVGAAHIFVFLMSNDGQTLQHLRLHREKSIFCLF